MQEHGKILVRRCRPAGENLSGNQDRSFLAPSYQLKCLCVRTVAVERPLLHLSCFGMTDRRPVYHVLHMAAALQQRAVATPYCELCSSKYLCSALNTLNHSTLATRARISVILKPRAEAPMAILSKSGTHALLSCDRPGVWLDTSERAVVHVACQQGLH